MALRRLLPRRSLPAALALLGAASRAGAQPCLESATAWQSVRFPAEGMAFSASFEATPGDYAVDGVTGFSLGEPADAAGLAVAVRFKPDGTVDALGRDGYAAAARLRYLAGETYRFLLKIDLVLDRYSVLVTPPGGPPETLVEDLPLPGGLRSITRLDRWSVQAASGGLRVCGLAVAAGPTDPYPD